MRDFNLFSILLLISIGTSFGQKETSHTFTIADGLPSNTVYTMYEDAQNLLWFGTDKGIAQYDGTSFFNYDLSNGLEDLEVFCIEEDHQGRLWFAGFNGRVCFIQSGQIHNSSTDPWLSNLDFKCLVRDIYEDQKDRIWLCGESGDVKVLDGEVLLETKMTESVLAFFSDKKGQVYGKQYRIPENVNELYTLDISSGKISVGLAEPALIRNSELFTEEEEWVYYRAPSLTSDYDAGRFSRFQDLSIIPRDIRVFETEGFSCNATFHNGFHLYSKQDGNYIEKELGVTTSAISWMIEDHQKNLWISTIGEGIFELIQSDIETVSDSLIDKAIKSMVQIDDSTTAVGTEQGEVWFIRPSSEFKVDLPNDNGRIRTMAKHNNELLVGTDGRFYKVDLENWKVNSPYPNRAWKEVRVKDDIFYGATSACFLREEGDSLKKLNNERVLCFLPLSNQHILLAHIHGLYDWSKEEEVPFEVKSLGFATINKLEMSQDSTFLFICSNGSGLIIQDQRTKREYSISSHNGLEGNNVYDLVQPNDSTVWLATNKGLVHLGLVGEKWEIKQIIKLNYEAGSNDIFSLSVTPEKLFFGTASGLYQIERKKLGITASDANIFFNPVTIAGEKMVDDSAGLKVDYRSNEISFSFRNDDYSSQSRSWETRLLPLQQSWTITSNSQQSFQELPAGNYEFQVRNKQFIEGTHQSVLFKILPNPYTSWWFMSLIWLGILTVLYMVYRVRSRREKAIVGLKLKNLEFEQRALFNQMNPHFIHNSLFAIQGFILENDRLNANRLLVSFSGLMQKMLFSSKERSITIENELELLEEYLSWQRSRLNNSFSFQIEKADIQSLLQKRIPSMILQPLLENAVEHGIIPRGTSALDGKVEIEFRALMSGVECILKDNGNQSFNSGEKKTLGVSLSILEERLSILRQMGFDASIRTESTGQQFRYNGAFTFTILKLTPSKWHIHV